MVSTNRFQSIRRQASVVLTACLTPCNSAVLRLLLAKSLSVLSRVRYFQILIRTDLLCVFSYVWALFLCRLLVSKQLQKDAEFYKNFIEVGFGPEVKYAMYCNIFTHNKFFFTFEGRRDSERLLCHRGGADVQRIWPHSHHRWDIFIRNMSLSWPAGRMTFNPG